MCSVDISNIHQPLGNVPSPSFEWFFGPNNASLPSGVTLMPTVVSSNSTANTYTSTLQFSPLNQSLAGIYTCRLGGNARLAADTRIFVNVAADASSQSEPGSPSTGNGGELSSIVIALNLSILFVVLISAIITIVLLCIIMR